MGECIIGLTLSGDVLCFELDLKVEIPFQALFFWAFAIGLIGSALAVILNRNPVASALCLVSTFLFLAMLFVTLEAFFLAAVQIIVYAGAVMVLFLFIIMLLDIKAERKRPVPYVKLLIVAIFGGFFATAFSKVMAGLCHSGVGRKTVEWGGLVAEQGPKELGKFLFSNAVLPFEVTGVLLLMATIGVILLSKREAKE